MKLWNNQLNEPESLNPVREIEISEQGYERWKQFYQTPSEWKRRIEMLADLIESAPPYPDQPTHSP